MDPESNDDSPLVQLFRRQGVDHVLELIMRPFSWEMAITLSKTCKAMRKCDRIWGSKHRKVILGRKRKKKKIRVEPLEDGRLPIPWTKFRRPMSHMLWDKVEVLAQTKGMEIVDTVWLARFIPTISTKRGFDSKPGGDKIADVVCLLVLRIKGGSHGGVLTLKTTWPPIEEEVDVYKSGTYQQESNVMCHALLQDDRGSDSRDFFLAQIDKVEIARSKKEFLNVVNPSAKRKRKGKFMVKIPRRVKMFERGAEALVIHYREDAFGVERQQYLSFVTSEGGRGGVEATFRALDTVEPLTIEAVEKEFLQSQESKEMTPMETTQEGSEGKGAASAGMEEAGEAKETGNWIKIDDPRRLLAVPGTCKNPRPAPSGMRHSARALPPVPGLCSVLFMNARKIANFIYDRVWVKGVSESQLMAVPMLATAKGFSERQQIKFKRRVESLRKTGQEASKLSDHVNTPNRRWMTLLFDFPSSPGSRMAGLCLPCRLNGEERDPRGYGAVLRKINMGWHCWPELWWRHLSEFVKTDRFQKGDHLDEVDKENPSSFLSVSACLITDIKSHHRAALKVLQRAKENAKDSDIIVKLANAEHQTDGYWMHSSRMDGHFSLNLYVRGGRGRDGLSQLATQLEHIAFDVVPNIVKNHQLFDRKGLTGLCLRFRLRSQLGLTADEGGGAGIVARFLQKVGRDGKLV